VTRFLHALLKEGNPADAVALYSFNWQIVKQASFTRKIPTLEHALHSLRGEAGTSLYDAILLASRDIEDRQGRKVLIVVTDGGDTTSHTDFQRATEAAQLADAVIYPVLVVPIPHEVGRNVGGENALTTLSERTGGRVFAPTLGSALDRAFDEIIRDLRTQYLLAYYPHDVPLTKDRFHSLQITLPDPALQVKARSGYYGEALPVAGARADGNPPEDSLRKPRKPQPPSQQLQPKTQRSSQN
jgi:Ca-activated chloride channel homolog